MPDSSADLASRLKTASTPIPDSFYSTLITANHILYHQGVFDAYGGHISARSPQDPSTFYIPAAIAPALVSSRSELIPHHVSTGEPVSADDASRCYLERFLHSEIYKRFPGVHAVIHAHSEPTIPFGITSVPLRAVQHTGSALGGVVPVYDIANHYKDGESGHNLLINNQRLGSTLAAGFAPASVWGKASGAIRSLISSGGSKTEGGGDGSGAEYPPHEVVLMRGHGFSAVGQSVEEVVYRSIYTVVNARTQRDAVLMQGAWNTAVVSERVAKVGKEGYTGGDSSGSTKLETVKFLSEREGKEAWESMKGAVAKPWELWVQEVKRNGLYENEYWEKHETNA